MHGAWHWTSAKMFNSLSGEISALSLQAMGLDEGSSLSLLAPFKMVGSVWRLPNNFPPLVTYSGKGLPQGMGMSVVMAEAARAPLVWRLHWALGPQLVAVTYMDDITLFLRSPHALNRAAENVSQFAEDFELTLARHKAKVWTNSDPRTLDECVHKYGFTKSHDLRSTWSRMEGRQLTYMSREGA